MTPRHLGGLGIESGVHFQWPTMPAIEAPVHLERKTNNREQIIAKRLIDRYKMVAEPTALTKAAQRAADSTLSADDVPQIASYARERTNDIFKKHFTQKPTTRDSHFIALPDLEIENTADLTAQQERWTRCSKAYGSYPEVTQLIEDARILDIPPMRFIRAQAPDAHYTIAKYSHRWGTQAAIDFVTGSFALPLQVLHPILQRPVVDYALQTVVPYSYGAKVDPRTVLFDIAKDVEKRWLQTRLVQRLTMW